MQKFDYERCKHCGMKKDGKVCCFEMNVPYHTIDTDKIEGYSQMSRADKFFAKREYWRKHPEYLKSCHVHCGVPCKEGELNERFGEKYQICVVCNFKTVPIGITKQYFSNAEIEKLQKPYLEN